MALLCIVFCIIVNKDCEVKNLLLHDATNPKYQIAHDTIQIAPRHLWKNDTKERWIIPMKGKNRGKRIRKTKSVLVPLIKETPQTSSWVWMVCWRNTKLFLISEYLF